MSDDVQTTARFSAPFTELIHNVHRFGTGDRERWSWRCGIVYSRMDPGYVDGACRYDHTVDSWEQLERDATEHLRKWHDVHPAPTIGSPLADEAIASAARLVQAWERLRLDTEEDQRLHADLIAMTRRVAAAYWVKRRAEVPPEATS